MDAAGTGKLALGGLDMADIPIDFWFTMGSTYSCLTVMRLPICNELRG